MVEEVRRRDRRLALSGALCVDSADLGVHGVSLAGDGLEHGVGTEGVEVGTGVGEREGGGNGGEGEGGVEGESVGNFVSICVSLLLAVSGRNVGTKGHLEHSLSRQSFQNCLLLVVRVTDAQVKHLVKAARSQQRLIQ